MTISLPASKMPLDADDSTTRPHGLLMAAPLALVVTAGLFQLMAALIDRPAALASLPQPIVEVELAKPRDETNPKIRPQQPPPPPPQAAQPPVSRVVAEPGGTPLAWSAEPELPAIDQAFKLATLQQPDQQASPIVRIEPKYPIKAAQDGINGWVRLSFNLTANGEVTDVRVLAAEPGRVFDQEAVRALKKWKYQPKLENGQPVAQSGLTVQLDFKLEQ